jgi:hypothetical protein
LKVTYTDFLLPASLAPSTSFTTAQRLLSARFFPKPKSLFHFFTGHWSPATGHCRAAARRNKRNERNRRLFAALIPKPDALFDLTSSTSFTSLTALLSLPRSSPTGQTFSPDGIDRIGETDQKILDKLDCGAFSDAWKTSQIVQEVLAQILWYHNITLRRGPLICSYR